MIDDLPAYEFVSIGGLIDAEKTYFNKLQENLPPNYSLMTNLPGPQLLKVLQDSQIYVHLMEGEHFGIAPIEGLAAGCVTIVHNSGGMKEFIPDEFRWETFADLEAKIVKYMEDESAKASWEIKRKQLWDRTSILTPETFQNNIWSNLQILIEQK
jgi:glycosyltransferase involved in cell wall biosynthesis